MAEARRHWQFPHWRWTGLAVACLLGACHTLVPRGVEQAPPPRPQVQPQPVNPGTIDNNIPHDTKRNRVALLVPLTGTNAGLGRSLENATQLALLDTGSEAVRITSYDTSGGAVRAAERAIADGAQLILGPLLADDVRAVAPVARGAGVPVLSFSNDASVAGNGAYIMGYLPAQSIERVVDYAHSRGINSFAGLIPSGLYGERSSTAFLRAVESAGGQVVALETYPRGTIAPALSRLVAKAPYGAVLIADSAASAALAAPLVRRSSPATHLLGTELWHTEAGVASRPPLAGAWYAAVSDTLYHRYAVKYRTRFGVSPYRLSSLGYDAVLLTIRIARDWPVGQRFPETRLRDRDGFAGIDGAFRFGRDGVVERALEVDEVRGGVLVPISPAPGSFGR